MTADRRLATYGSLAPGQPNHGQLAGLSGTWSGGTVRGRLVQAGWGLALGFPALELDDAGGTVSVQVFESDDLPGHWGRLDDFEGDGYVRTRVVVETSKGAADAFIYAAAPQSS